MILEDILCDVKEMVLSTGYFNTFYELAEQTNTKTNEGTKTYPRYYQGDGQYLDLYDFDVDGTGYIRKSSSTEVTETEQVKGVCDDKWLKVTYPLRMVACVPKISDDAFSDDKLVYELIEVLQGTITGIVNTRKVYLTVTRYETNRNKVWSEEVYGLEEIINPELSYVYIDFDITVTIKKDCLIPDCYG